MLKNISDEEYMFFVNDILDNKEFNKLDDIEHHGISRLDHSLRVSYYSYKITKLLKLDYETTARAGLLHDFFLSDNNRKFKDKIVSTFVHPKYAVLNSKKYFYIDNLTENIIESHMFPIYKCLPKYAESWVVSLVDKVVATYEFSRSYSTKFAYMTNILILLVLNNLR